MLDGDRFIINGQKVWTSGANYADFCFLFCRTNTDVPKHKGISIILLPMKTPGVTVRPLKEIVHPEHPDLNEVFLDDVILPVTNLVGEMNNGWAMANGSLAHERSMVWLMGVIELETSMNMLLENSSEMLQGRGSHERSIAADEIVKLYIDTHAALPWVPRICALCERWISARAGTHENVCQRSPSANVTLCRRPQRSISAQCASGTAPESRNN